MDYKDSYNAKLSGITDLKEKQQRKYHQGSKGIRAVRKEHKGYGKGIRDKIYRKHDL